MASVARSGVPGRDPPPAEHWSGGGARRRLLRHERAGRACLRGARRRGRGGAASRDLARPGPSAAVLPGAAPRRSASSASSRRLSPSGTDCASGDAVYVAEIDLDALEGVAGGGVRRIEPLPRYPSVTRDISILVDASLAAGTIRATIRDAAPRDTGARPRVRSLSGQGHSRRQGQPVTAPQFRSADRTLNRCRGAGRDGRRARRVDGTSTRPFSDDAS